jgi:hypothetical protein
MDSLNPVNSSELLASEKPQYRLMKERIERSLEDQETRQKVIEDFTYTFGRLGLTSEQSQVLCQKIFDLLHEPRPLRDIEADALTLFESIVVEVGNEQVNLIDILHTKLKDRADIITNQVQDHLRDITGSVIDYGAGDGQVTQQLYDRLGISIEGVDVRDYRALSVKVPIGIFEGFRVAVSDGTYQAALLTNVLHHEQDNEQILNELDRIVQNRLVVLETVPVGETEEIMEHDKDRTFMNDYLYNRLFHNADVPVPGTFETPQGWKSRFLQHGWQLTSESDLGYDQPTIKDRHYLMVFERNTEQ